MSEMGPRLRAMASARGSLLTRGSARSRRGGRRRHRRAPEKPLIGVTTSEVRKAQEVRQVQEGEPPRHEMALGLAYMRTIELAGGVPVVMPPLGPDSINPLLDQVAGICLSGGPDLDPKTYAAQANPHLGPTWPELDFVELAVARGADERDLPILAICRGMQALNVARGGTLHQHLEDGDFAHRQEDPPEQPTHEVRIDPGSRLAQILGTTSIEVNSFHHQAIDELGDGLRAVAWAPDGVIEAIEAIDRTEFMVGVQWHAEGLWASDRHLDLFREFIEASRRHVPGGRR
jgi:putative glutamine amidotransferase